MSLTTIRADLHLVKDTSISRMFRRRLNFDDILTFWNQETGQWILAYWVNKRTGVVDEMEDLGMAFEKVTPELVQAIVQCWKTIDWSAKKKRLLSKMRDEKRRKDEEIGADQDRWDWMKKRQKARGRQPVPFAFSSPITGGKVD